MLGSLIRAGAMCAALMAAPAMAQNVEPLPLDGFSDAIHHWRNEKGDAYRAFRPDQVAQIADNLLLYQRANGGWVQNRDPTRILSEEERAAIVAERDDPAYSFDNRNIYTQIEYLMGSYERLGTEAYRAAAMRGLDLTLNAQTPRCGGWPHTVPADNDYHGRITFADEVMSGNLTLLRKVTQREFPFTRVDEAMRARAEAGLAKGDACVLALQIRQNGALTGWAGQYDPETLQPMGGRRFELAAIVSQETVEVLRYLMSIPSPSPAQIEAIEAGVSWLEASRIPDMKIEEVRLDPPVRFDHHTATRDRRLVADPGGPGLWARFYDLADNSVVLANRDGVRAATYDQVHIERRTGYSWYGTWPRTLLARDYPAWKARLGR